MASKLKIPSPLRRFTSGNAVLEVEGGTLKSVLEELFNICPEIKNHLIEDNGELRNFVNIFVNGENTRQNGGLNYKIKDDDDIRIIPSIAGGSTSENILSADELIRYSRHLSLPEVGIEGQKKIKKASVLIIGAGGLGSPVLLYLAAAGVGTIGILDFDTVDESNLQRQVLFKVDQKDKSKVDAAKEQLESLNPNIKFNLFNIKLSSQNALKIIKDYDIIIDGTDNFSTRYLVNDACVLLKKPNVYGSIYRFDGQLSIFNYKEGPCYRCLYPSPPPPGLVPSCAEGGVIGVLPGIIGTLQANEALKIILDIGDLMVNRFLLFDALSMEFNELKINKDEECKICGINPSIDKLIDYDDFCGINLDDEKNTYSEIDVYELQKSLNTENCPTIIDVREDYEVAISKLNQAIHIPMNKIPGNINKFDTNSDYIIICRSGVRSAQICEFLIDNNFKSVSNLIGGINEWAKKIDKTLTIY